MVKLKNIKRNNISIECDIYPEDSANSGHIIVDMNTEELKNSVLPAGYEWCINHVNHARRRLIELLGEKDLPEEDLVMWH